MERADKNNKMILLIIFIISFLYLFYIIWLTESFQEIEKNNDVFYPTVSIIISAKNEELNIDNLISKLMIQNYPVDKFEIIIANDKSEDNTLEKIKKYANKIRNLSIIDIKNTPKKWGAKKWAINQCIDKSSGEIILQTDADCSHKSTWLFEMVQPFQDHNIGFVCGPSYIGKKNNFWDDTIKLESIAQESFTYANSKRNLFISCTARNIAFRKSLFSDINGYEGINHIESGDDDLLLHKVVKNSKAEVFFLANQEALVSSNSPNSIKEFYMQRLRYASKGLLYFKLQTPKEVKVVLPFLMVSNLAIIFSIINIIATQSVIWLLPLILKSIADFLIITKYMNLINIKFNVLNFMILTILHPFYIVLLGTISPLTKVQWK